MTVAGGYTYGSIFNTVFFVVLVSLLVQGTLLPFIAVKAKMIDEEDDVLKTFTDYEESSIEFIPLELGGDSDWASRKIRDISLPPSSIVAAIERNGVTLVPRGDTVLEKGDKLILALTKPDIQTNVSLSEESVGKDHPWNGKMLRDIKSKDLILMILRDGKTIIPFVSTEIRKGDVLVKNTSHV